MDPAVSANEIGAVRNAAWARYNREQCSSDSYEGLHAFEVAEPVCTEIDVRLFKGCANNSRTSD